MEKKNINIEEIYSQKVYDYLRPSFPYTSNEELWHKVSLYHTMTEEYQLILKTIKEIVDMTIEETAKNGMAYYNSTNYVVKKQLEAEMLKTKEQVVYDFSVHEKKSIGEGQYVHCHDKFDVEIVDGDVIEVQGEEGVKVYMKDGQLYFAPYGVEDRVSAYFSNDLIKPM